MGPKMQRWNDWLLPDRRLWNWTPLSCGRIHSMLPRPCGFIAWGGSGLGGGRRYRDSVTPDSKHLRRLIFQQRLSLAKEPRLQRRLIRRLEAGQTYANETITNSIGKLDTLEQTHRAIGQRLL